jgi:hypothetical protein
VVRAGLGASGSAAATDSFSVQVTCAVCPLSWGLSWYFSMCVAMALRLAVSRTLLKQGTVKVLDLKA